MNFKNLVVAAMRKRAAAVLTPEAEQAAVQGGMGDPAMMGGMPPQDPSMMGGAPAGAPPAPGGMPGAPQGSGGGQLPPEILQDQQFIQWLASQGVQLDPASGMFIGPDGQPLPAEAIMQAYQAYQQEMMAAQGGGMVPQDPSMMGGAQPEAGGMPPEGAMPSAGAPPPEAAGMPPQDPAAVGGAPGGALPPEILNDQMFMQFMTEAVGAQFDPNSGMFIDTQSGQPIPPDMVMQAYQAFQQQAQGMGGMPQDPAAMGGAMPPEAAAAGAQPGIPPEIMDQFQSMIDSVIQNYTAELDKKIETLVDKLDTVKLAIESMRDTDDKRAKEDKDKLKEMQDELAEELNPTVKTAALEQPKPRAKAPKQAQTRPMNVFDFIKLRK